jgi:hypothetical protein
VLAHARKWQWNYADEFCWERAGIPQQVARRFKNQFEPIYHFTKGEWKFNPNAVKHESKAVPKAKGKGAGNTNAAQRQGHVSAVDGNDVAAGMAYPGKLELSPSYVDLIVNRWQDFTGKQAVHAETGETFNASR